MPVRYWKTILCLANSRKLSGRCIAGREIANGQFGDWIRPISAREKGEISEEERRFENGTSPAVLDVVRIPMIEPQPHTFQVENHHIDDGYYGEWSRTARRRDALEAVDGDRGLWSNDSSGYNAINDRVDEIAADPRQGSLRLV